MKSVDNGAALLDERLPGWRDVINGEELDLANCEKCVLGQLFGDYERGVQILGLDSEAKYGFVRRGNSYWSSLTRAWLRKIHQ